MKKSRSLFYPIFIFVLAQIAWFVMVILWIYRYITSNFILETVGEYNTIQVLSKSSNVVALIGGLLLLVTVSVAMSLIFRNLTTQLKITVMYDNFIANMTHELKSPLSSIQLYLETLQSRQVPTEKQQEFIKFMMRDANRLGNLIESILAISGLEQKKMLFDYQVVNAGDTFTRIFRESISQFNLAEESVTINGQANLPCVLDYSAMRMVMDNLVENALKYSTRSPRLLLELSATRSYIIVQLTDNGIGITLKDQKHIFKKFFRIYNSNIPNVKGTGLGLYWVREIIKAHGGKVNVESGGPDKGTTISIELPIYKTVKQHYLNNLLKLTQKRQHIRKQQHE